jgi:hypothetical protein
VTEQAAQDELDAPGRRLWESVTVRFELEVHEEILLLEACRATDLLHKLDGIVRTEGTMVDTSQGPRVHPAAVEARAHRQGLARIMAALRLPSGDGNDSKRPQRRSGARKPYGVRGSA